MNDFRDEDGNEIDPKDIKIEFAPGCFNEFEGTQEELNALMAEITAKVRSGELLKESEPLDFDDEDMDYIQELIDKKMSGGDNGGNNKLH